MSFVKSCISVVVPDEGLFVKGWAITCTSSKTVNSINQLINYSGFTVVHILLKIAENSQWLKLWLRNTFVGYDKCGTSLPLFPPSLSLSLFLLHLPPLQIHYEAVGKATDRLVIPECKLSIKWVGEEGNEELLPSDLHCNISFTGSHQKKSESYFHLHSRCSQGETSYGSLLFHITKYSST